MSDSEQFYINTGYNTLKEARAYNEGFNAAINDLRQALTQRGVTTSYFDVMLDGAQDSENSWFASAVLGG